MWYHASFTKRVKEKAAFYFAKSLINDPELLFLDEPTSSLDPDIADKTRKFLKRIKEEKKVEELIKIDWI